MFPHVTVLWRGRWFGHSSFITTFHCLVRVEVLRRSENMFCRLTLLTYTHTYLPTFHRNTLPQCQTSWTRRTEVQGVHSIESHKCRLRKNEKKVKQNNNNNKKSQSDLLAPSEECRLPFEYNKDFEDIRSGLICFGDSFVTASPELNKLLRSVTWSDGRYGSWLLAELILPFDLLTAEANFKKFDE